MSLPHGAGGQPDAGGEAKGEDGRQKAHDDPGRNESEEQRADRNLADLLQEMRVAGLGVQVLFGFLLSLPFTRRFTELSSNQRGIYLTSLLLAALSTALLCAPVAFHRWVFRRHEKERLVRVANTMVLCGLGTVGLAISAAVLLVVSFVERGLFVPVVVGPRRRSLCRPLVRAPARRPVEAQALATVRSARVSRSPLKRTGSPIAR